MPEREGVAALIGNTPLVEIRRLNPHRERGVRVFAKLESRNPGGSVKDRPALYMVEDGERRGALTPGKALVDATSGNTGIAYALLCASKGHRCRLFMPENVSRERKRILANYGADLVFTDPLEGQDGAIDAVRALVKEEAEAYFYPDQYANPLNPRAHYETTGPEIWRQTDGEITHFVAALGTSGTMMGTGAFLRGKKPDIPLVSLEPSGPFHGLEGLKHMATSHVPGIFRPEKLGLTRESVETEAAYDLMRRLAKEEGLLVGPSAGAALAGALKLAESLNEGVIVTVFPDTGERYLSLPLWED